MTEIELGIIQKQEPAQAITETGGDDEEKQPKEPLFSFAIPTQRYTQVIGLRRAKVVLHKLLQLPLQKPEQFEKLKLKKSAGVILYGFAGVGKSYIVKALCGELGIKMAYITPSSILSKYVGESAAHVKQLFAEANKNTPCAVFIDECDVLLQNRDNVSSEGGSSELKSAISEFLIEVSKIHDDKTSHIYLIGATNKIFDVDSAHKRSGRFEYIIYLRAPSFFDRRELFKLYLERGRKDAPEYFKSINYTLLSLATMYYSPADIERLCDISIRNAIEKKVITISTRNVQRALWSREAGKSSLDPSYLEMAVKYIPQHKSFWRSLISKAYKQKEMKEPKLDKSEREMIKDMIKDVQSYMRWHWAVRMVRVFGKGFPA